MPPCDERCGQPITVTINGIVVLPVRDEPLFEKLLELVEWLDTVELLRERLDGANESEESSLEEVERGSRKGMEFRVEIDPAAEADIEEVFDWIAQHSLERAEVWQSGLFKAIEGLKRLPRRCSRAPEREAYGGEVRQLLYGKRAAYRVLFNVRGETVRVVAVLHTSRGSSESL